MLNNILNTVEEILEGNGSIDHLKQLKNLGQEELNHLTDVINLEISKYNNQNVYLNRFHYYSPNGELKKNLLSFTHKRLVSLKFIKDHQNDLGVALCRHILEKLIEKYSEKIEDREKTLLQHAIFSFFSFFLEQDKKNATAYKHTTIELALIPGINTLFDFEEKNERTNFFSLFAILKKYPRPRELIPLFVLNTTESYQLETYVIFLLEQGVSEKEILSSHLIQTFMAMHFHALDDPKNSQMHKFYDRMETYDIAGPLLTMIKETDSSIPGINYSLYGEIQKEKLINSVKKKYGFVLPEDLSDCFFNVLFTLYGPCLFKMRFKYTNKEFTLRELEQLHQVDYTSLVDLIRNLVADRNDHALEKLSNNLSKEQIEALLKQKSFILIHLAPYLDDAYGLTNYDALKPYIDKGGDPIEKIMGLLALLQRFAAPKPVLGEQLYGLLLDDLVNVNCSKTESLILEHLRKEDYDEFLPIIKNKIIEFTEQVNQSKHSILQCQLLEIDEKWKRIENEWKESLHAINLLMSIEPNVLIDYPRDIYQFYTRLLYEQLPHQKDNFNAVELMQKIIPTYNEDGESVSTLERALVEILAVIYPVSFDPIATFLETTPRNNRQWMTHIYGDSPLLVKASMAGNIKIIKKMSGEKNTVFAEKHYSEALIAAAETSQWEVVEYFCLLNTDNLPECEAIGLALENAAELGNLRIVEKICKLTTENKPTSACVGQAVLNAVFTDEWEIVRYLCAMTTENRPDSDVIGDTLREAADAGLWDVVESISAMTSTNKPNASSIVYVLKEAINSNLLDSVKTICSMTTANKPSLSVIEEVYNYAKQKEPQQIANYLKKIIDDQTEPTQNLPTLQKRLRAADRINNLPDDEAHNYPSKTIKFM